MAGSAVTPEAASIEVTASAGVIGRRAGSGGTSSKRPAASPCSRAATSERSSEPWRASSSAAGDAATSFELPVATWLSAASTGDVALDEDVVVRDERKPRRGEAGCTKRRERGCHQARVTGLVDVGAIEERVRGGRCLHTDVAPVARVGADLTAAEHAERPRELVPLGVVDQVARLEDECRMDGVHALHGGGQNLGRQGLLRPERRGDRCRRAGRLPRRAAGTRSP